MKRLAKNVSDRVPGGAGLSWQRQALARARVLWALKALGTVTFMPLFFWGYFGVLQNPLFPAKVMPLTPLDSWISFSPGAFGVYASLWLYVSLPPAFLPDLPTLLRYGFWISALCLFCLAIFWFWPTTIPPVGIDWEAHPQIGIIKGLDLSGNACPSLHVATAVFSAAWLQYIMKDIAAPRWLVSLNWMQCAAIIWSTMAVRQHVVVDVVAGIAVGVAFAILSLRHEGRLRAPLQPVASRRRDERGGECHSP